MKLISTLFPISLYLNIFQLEEYNVPRFLRWVSKNILVRSIPQKRRLVYTLKTKLLLILSFLIIVLISTVLIVETRNYFLLTIIGLIILSQFYLPLVISKIILLPFEQLIIQKNIRKTHKKILSIKGLKIIAITGSYGKTSVKEFLYQLIKNKYKTLRTPESFNTVLGISKVVDYELDNSYKYFICEMAAYHKGDIQKLCKMVPPNYGIITGITTQHLERFGSLENIIKTKFELYENIQQKRNIILNSNDVYIIKEIQKRNTDNLQGYLTISNVQFSKLGSIFDINYQNKKYKVQTKLFGFSNIENLTGAITMAIKLGVNIEELIDKCRYLIPVANRFNIKHLNKATIIDNTFSSNERSYKEMIETARVIKGSKVLVTPGLVELGKQTELINASVGRLSNNVFDKIILVGNNIRTKSLARDLIEKPEFIADSRKEYFEKIEELSKLYDWLFLENDLPENY